MKRRQGFGPLKIKWDWAWTQWETAKEFGLVDESRKQPAPAPIPGRATKHDVQADPRSEDDPTGLI